ncbi:hypothetical protein Ndes2437B_g01566 [Nannochloris sp. 'desiccata']
MEASIASSKRSGENNLHLISLPEGALKSVFTNLDAWRDALRLSLTCKQLRDIGKPHLHRTVGCLNCCSPLASAAVAHTANAGSLSISFRLTDGEAMCLGEPDDLLPNALKYDKEGPCTSHRLVWEFLRQHIAPTEEALGLKVRQVYCNRCNLYLGVQITEIKGLRAGTDLDMSSWRLGLVLGNVFCCFKYLTVLDSTGQNEDFTLPGILWQDFKASSLYRCAMQRIKHGTDGVVAADFEQCNGILFDDRSILSKEHWWKAQEPAFPTPLAEESVEGAMNNNNNNINNNTTATAAAPPEGLADGDDGGEEPTTPPTGVAAAPSTSAEVSNGEAAWYINHIDADVLVDPPVEMELAQGKMSVSRIWCSNCIRVVGWKFIECLESGKNAHHCGRWGILEGRVKKSKLPDGKYIRNKT